MPRNGSGTYTAPANSVNPAVAATTIDASDFNDFVDDVETALTDSIARDGQTTTSAVVPFASGIKADTIVENSSNTGVTVDSVLIKDGGVNLGTAGTLSFEGATADAFETTVTVTDPTADRTVTIPNATTTLVGTDTTDTLTNKTLTSAVLNTGVSGTAVLDEDNMASDSATQVATQQSIKAYVDTEVAGAGVSQATQAAIEAETNEDTYVPPDLLKHAPGMAKGWVHLNGTGTAAIQASHNVTSITDQGTGIYDVTWATDFSSANYCCVCTAGDASANLQSSEDSDNRTVGVVRVRALTSAGGAQDPVIFSVTAFGDQ